MRTPGPAIGRDDAQLARVLTLIKAFSFERYVYLTITSLSVVMLLAAAAKLLLSNKPDLAVLTALFGSSGLITYSLGRVLRMWDQAMNAIFSTPGGG
jgi:hypothetical protein